MKRIASRLLGVAFACSLASTVSAQTTSEQRTLAETLFQAGQRAFEAGDFAQACPRFAESMRLDPAGGTLLNLARCHETEGKLASAWAEYQEALVWAQRDQQPDRMAVCQQSIAALGPRLSSITITLAEAAAESGIEVRMDGTLLGPAAFGVPTPVDPGEHVIEASAPGKVPHSVSVTIAREKERRVVVIDPLPDAAADSAAFAASSESLGPVRSEPDGFVTDAGAVADSSRRHPARRQALGLVVGGVGLGALWVGGGFGIRAVRKMNASDHQCPGGACTAAGAELSRKANRSANVANVAVGVGVLGIGIGTYLLYFDAHRPRGSAHWKLSPELDEQSVRLRATRRF